MKVKLETLNEEEKMVTLDALYTAAGSVRGREATKLFLRDLLTESERIMLGRRIIIARLLLSGAAYSEITSRLGVGHDTIARVERWLEDKAPGYEQAIDGLNEVHAQRKRNRSVQSFNENPTWKNTVAMLKKKYPLHFLLFPWPAEYKSKKRKK
jgi:uncharacterized protein YerC